MKKRKPSNRELQQRIRILQREKRNLSKALDCRVGNNLQTVTSLVALSRLHTDNQEAIDILKAVHCKIHAISLMHQTKGMGDRLDHVDMGKYTQNLMNHIARIYHRQAVDRNVNAEGIFLDINQANPVACVLNELIANALKHAFSQGKAGAVDVEMKQSSDGTTTIIVRDTGIGMPQNIDTDKPETLGFELVRNIVVHQLCGTFDVISGDALSGKGTAVSITFQANQTD